MSDNIDLANTVKGPDQPKDRENDNEPRVAGTLSQLPGKPGPPPGRSPLFRR